MRKHTAARHVLLLAVCVAALGLLSKAQGGSFPGQNGLIAFTCGSDVCTVAADGSGLTTLASNATDPAWSADGTKIAYVGGGGVTVANANGSSPQVVAAGATQPTWSKTGSKLAYVKSGDIYVANANGSGETNLTSSAASDADPAFSPDGSKLAFASNSGGNYDIWTLEVANPSSLVHVTQVNGSERSPSWSPDGQTIVYSSAGELYEIDPTGTDTPSDLGLAGTDPAFSPDGTQLTYVDSHGNVAVADAIGRNAQAIRASGTDAQPDWQAVNAAPVTAVGGAGPPANVTYPTITLPSGSGAPVVGQALGSSVGTWSGATPLAYTYQWKRCDAGDRLNGTCVEIGGATSASYAPTQDDFGKRLRLAVTATNAQGSATQNSEPSEPVTALAPKVTATPPINGQNMVGQTLELGPGVWTGTLPLAFTYSWRRCNPMGDPATCVEIPGATSSTYVPTTDDIGYAIRVWVTGTNTLGSDVAITNHTYPIVDRPHFAPAPVAKPAIEGTFEVGRELSANVAHAAFSGDAPITTALIWERCDATGGSCHQILGAARSAYTPTTADVGYRLRLAVTAANPYGSTTSLSDPSDPVLATPPHRVGRDIVGTGAVEYLAGGGWDDTILGLGGNDTLLGGNGSDKLDGGPGDDVIFGGAGVDTILGGPGSDTIYAADGERDVIDCGPGRDRAVVDAFDKVVNCEVVERPGG